MANRKISEMTALVADDSSVDEDYIPVVDPSEAAAQRNKRMTLTEIGKAIIQRVSSFVPSGIGATTSTVQAALRLFTHTSQYATEANFNTATTALSGTIGLPNTNIIGQAQVVSDADATVPLVVRGNSLTQSNVLQSWQKSSGDSYGYFHKRTVNDGYANQDDPPDAGLIAVVGENAGDIVGFSFYDFGAMLFYKGPSQQLEFWGKTQTLGYHAVVTVVADDTYKEFQIRNNDDDNSIILHYPASGDPYISTQSDNVNMLVTAHGTGKVYTGKNFGVRCVPGVELDMVIASSGAEVIARFANDSNTAGAGVKTYLQVAGTSAGDPYATFAVVGGSSWSIGVDNSDSDAFVIANSGALGTSNILHLSTGGDVTFVAGTAVTGASSTGKSGLRLPHGTAPTSPVNGDVWTDTSGLYVRINGVTKTVTLS